jgi:pilus assembly protein CpaC
MSSRSFARPLPRCHAVILLALLLLVPTLCQGQPLASPQVNFKVQGPNQQLEMIVNTSRILTLGKAIPKVLVMDPNVVKVTPLNTNQVQVAALNAGVTQINVWDDADRVYSIDVWVHNDARQLAMVLKNQFPNCSLQVFPLASSVVIKGYVDRPETVDRVIQMAEEYYPKAITNITVGGVQTVLLHVKMMEVSRTKMRALGFDWANLNGNDFVIQSVSGLVAAADPLGGAVTSTAGDTVRFGIVDGSNSFFGFLEALRQNNMVKVLANPTVVTTSGRPASFQVGGEFPILIPAGLGSTSIEYKQFGTRVDFVPIVLGNGNLRLEVRPQVSEIDESRSVTIDSITVPGLRSRYVDTAVEMKPGQTLALAGLVQERVEAENKGLPWLADLPWFGAGFRRVEEKINEIELLVMITPELVDALDPHEVPPCLPGAGTTSPNDIELYWRGYLETPRCCPPGAPPAFYNPGDVLPRGAQPMHAVPGTIPGGLEQVPTPAPEAVPPDDASARRRVPELTGVRSGRGSTRVPTRMVSSPDVPPSPPAASLQTAQPEPHDSEPGLIGPFGYDDLN